MSLFKIELQGDNERLYCGLDCHAQAAVNLLRGKLDIHCVRRTIVGVDNFPIDCLTSCLENE